MKYIYIGLIVLLLTILIFFQSSGVEKFTRNRTWGQKWLPRCLGPVIDGVCMKCNTRTQTWDGKNCVLKTCNKHSTLDLFGKCVCDDGYPFNRKDFNNNPICTRGYDNDYN